MYRETLQTLTCLAVLIYSTLSLHIVKDPMPYRKSHPFEEEQQQQPQHQQQQLKHSTAQFQLDHNQFVGQTNNHHRYHHHPYNQYHPNNRYENIRYMNDPDSSRILSSSNSRIVDPLNSDITDNDNNDRVIFNHNHHRNLMQHYPIQQQQQQQQQQQNHFNVDGSGIHVPPFIDNDIIDGGGDTGTTTIIDIPTDYGGNNNDDDDINIGRYLKLPQQRRISRRNDDKIYRNYPLSSPDTSHFSQRTPEHFVMIPPSIDHHRTPSHNLVMMMTNRQHPNYLHLNNYRHPSSLSTLPDGAAAAAAAGASGAGGTTAASFTSFLMENRNNHNGNNMIMKNHHKLNSDMNLNNIYDGLNGIDLRQKEHKFMIQNTNKNDDDYVDDDIEDFYRSRNNQNDHNNKNNNDDINEMNNVNNGNNKYNYITNTNINENDNENDIGIIHHHNNHKKSIIISGGSSDSRGNSGSDSNIEIQNSNSLPPKSLQELFRNENSNDNTNINDDDDDDTVNDNIEISNSVSDGNNKNNNYNSNTNTNNNNNVNDDKLNHLSANNNNNNNINNHNNNHNKNNADIIIDKNKSKSTLDIRDMQKQQQQQQNNQHSNKRSGGVITPQNIPPVTHSQLLLRSARGQRQYDVPQIECPPAMDGMERFACPTPDRQGRYRCIDDHVLCDGFIDCPEGEDEDRQACMFYKTTKAHLDVLADALLRWARGR